MKKREREINIFEHIKIQTNNLCTRRCAFCFFGQKNYKINDVRLDKKIYEKIIQDLEEINFKGRIGLFEANEPLTDPRIYQFVLYAKNKLPEAYHMLITNGELLNKQNLEILMAGGLDKLIVSIYDKKTMGKMKKLAEAAKSPPGKVEIIDYIGKKLWDNRGGNVKYKYAPTPQNPLEASCERVRKIMYVRPSGKVVSCFSDFFEVNVMGDVKKDSLMDIWQGAKFVAFRNELDRKNRRFNELCRRCNYPGRGWFYKNVV